jgi:uncharacterized membrane protein
MKTRNAVISVLAILAAGLGAWAALYGRLPARIPIHWNIHGQVDGWAGKGTALTILAGMVLLFLLFILAGEWLSPVSFKISPFRETFNYVMVICAALMLYIHAIVLLSGLHPNRNFGRWLVGGLFVFFALIGNLLGKVRRNFWMGIRTPWTLASEEVWIATHRLGARLMVAAGIAGAVCVALGVPLPVCFALLIGSLLIPVLYSLWLSKKLEGQT